MRTFETTPAPLASIRVGASTTRPLHDELQNRVLRAMVDSRRNAPTMIEITFRDDEADILEQAGITFGSRIEVWGQAAGAAKPTLVGSGEVTALEGDFFDLSVITVVRAYDATHRLQRISRVRTFMNMTDSDIARRVAQEAHLPLGRIEATRTSHAHLAQMNQTDWEFLSQRACEIGYDFGVDEDGFFFRRTARQSGAPVVLELQRNLRTFRPRVTAAALAPEVEMRVWDPLAAQVVSTQTRPDEEAVSLAGAEFDTVMRATQRPTRPPTPPVTNSHLGPAPTTDGRIVVAAAPATGAAIGSASLEALQGPTQRVAGSFAEAQALAWGDPRLRAGAEVRVLGPPQPFAGTWKVNAAQHVFDLSEGGYRTRLQLGNPEDRTLLGLTTAPKRAHSARGVDGLVCGVVTDVNDPAGKGRVKVVLPWLAPDHETDWAPVVQAGGGRRAGAMMLPEVGDQVLLGFELGDSRRPYVIGGVLSNSSTYAVGGPAVEATGHTADIVRRGIVSPSGNMLAFHDKVPPGQDRSPSQSSIVLGTQDGSLGLVIDQVAGTVTLACRPCSPNSRTTAGQIRIDCGDGGTVAIAAGSGGHVSIDGGSTLSMRAENSISIESAGVVTVKGSKIELN
ncbi:VgrG-related protein [Streptomyces wuyuanensis]|uniref:VgrG-related protein n=1 Tax=Streptomyces wuyuanensis TaxID=1196353 RepID=UPI003434E611